MKNAKEAEVFLLNNYGNASDYEQALQDVVEFLLVRVRALERQVAPLTDQEDE